jgi:hypothetical protein
MRTSTNNELWCNFFKPTSNSVTISHCRNNDFNKAQQQRTHMVHMTDKRANIDNELRCNFFKPTSNCHNFPLREQWFQQSTTIMHTVSQMLQFFSNASHSLLVEEDPNALSPKIHLTTHIPTWTYEHSRKVCIPTPQSRNLSIISWG